jgi:hypothetical protein
MVMLVCLCAPTMPWRGAAAAREIAAALTPPGGMVGVGDSQG